MRRPPFFLPFERLAVCWVVSRNFSSVTCTISFTRHR